MIKIANNEKYVTYFPPEKLPFNPDSITIKLTGKRAYINKPDCAFWGSPINVEYGWKEWCEIESFGNYDWTNPIIWKLKTGTKILEIDWEDILAQNCILEKYTFNPYEKYTNNPYANLGFEKERAINFSKLVEDEIYAVHLIDGSIGHHFIPKNPYEGMFNSWDCDSIVVLDKDKIIFE